MKAHYMHVMWVITFIGWTFARNNKNRCALIFQQQQKSFMNLYKIEVRFGWWSDKKLLEAKKSIHCIADFIHLKSEWENGQGRNWK